MPTENRSSNTEMVSVPEGFMLAERSIWTEQQVEAATACITRLKGVPGMRDCDLAMAAIDAAQCKAPDIALSDLLPAPQPHPDPIAWMVGTAFWWTREEAERDAAATGLPIVELVPMAGVAPAQQRQGEPVALPARKSYEESFSVHGQGQIMGWNACLDEIAKLGPLYTRADPALSPDMIALPLSLLETACNGYAQQQGHALNEIRELLKGHCHAQKNLLEDCVESSSSSDTAGNGLPHTAGNGTAGDTGLAEVERLRAENEAFDAGMRNLACQLSAGGYNAETLTADQLLEKVQWGLAHLTETQTRLVDTLRAQLAERGALLSSVQAEIYEAAVMASVIREAKPFAISTTLFAPVRNFELGDAISKAGVLVERLSSIADTLSASAEPSAPVSFQARVQPWLMQCFGEMIAGDREERNHRFLEEALELVQALGATAAEAHQLVDYVFGRAVGEPGQEVGGVMVTLAALCLANGLDMHQLAETELARIWTKVDAIRAKQASKPQFGPLPGVYPDRKQ